MIVVLPEGENVKKPLLASKRTSRTSLTLMPVKERFVSSLTWNFSGAVISGVSLTGFTVTKKLSLSVGAFPPV